MPVIKKSYSGDGRHNYTRGLERSCPPSGSCSLWTSRQNETCTREPAKLDNQMYAIVLFKDVWFCFDVAG